MTAVEDFIADLRRNRTAEGDQPLAGDVDLFIAALQELTGGQTFAVQTYAPTVEIENNLDSVGFASARFLRLGDWVIVFGQFGANPSAAGDANTSFNITLPVASNFTTGLELGGSFAANNFAIQRAGAIVADTIIDRAVFQWTCEDAGLVSFSFMFCYQVIS